MWHGLQQSGPIILPCGREQPPPEACSHAGPLRPLRRLALAACPCPRVGEGCLEEVTLR